MLVLVLGLGLGKAGIPKRASFLVFELLLLWCYYLRSSTLGFWVAPVRE
jgi:hypothetical protein